MIGDRLFRLTPRDSQVTPLDCVYKFVQLITTNINQNVAFQIPKLSTFLLYSIFCDYLTTAPEVASELKINISAVQQGTPFSQIDLVAAAAGQRLQIRRDFAGLPIFAERLLEVQGTASAAVLSKALIVGVTGVLIPRGNFGEGDLRTFTL